MNVTPSIAARPLLAALAASAALIGCDSTGTSIIVQGIAAPENDEDCSYTADGDVFFLRTYLDTETQAQMSLTARYRNEMFGDTVNAGTNSSEVLNPTSHVTPVRFDFRWECESNGFTNIDQFLMPYFQPRQPFCLNERVEAGDAVGFDAVAASGSAAAPGGQGLVAFTPIPSLLGDGFRTAFLLGSEAETCLNAPAGPTKDAACQQVEAYFAEIGGSYNRSNENDLRTWLPYAAFNGGARFPIRMVGQFEMVTSAGDMVVSTDLSHVIEVCNNCGASTACTR